MECRDAVLALTTLALVIYFIYKKLTQNHDFWEKQNVPFVKPSPLVGSVGSLSEDGSKRPLHEIEMEWYNTYGRVYGRYDGTNPVLCVGDPDILKKVFQKDFHYFQNRRDMKFHDPIMDNTLFILEGEPWKRVRSIVSPTFTTKKLKRMLPLLRESCDVLIERLEETSKKSGTVDFLKHFEGFVLHAIGRCAFGMKMDSLKDPNNDFVKKSKKLFEERWSWRTKVTLICPWLMKVLRMKLLNPETTEFYKKTIIEVLEDRKKDIEAHDDFLQMIMDAEYETEDSNNNGDTVCPSGICEIDETNRSRKKPYNKGLTHDEMLSQCVTFFLAGFDATSTLLSNAVYYLTMHPEYQEQVVDEMNAALEEFDGEMCYEALSKMKFTEAVLNECLRLCPAMVRSERRCHEDYYIEESNIVLKKGMLVSIPVYAIQHDPEWFPDPYDFKPERFYDPDPSRPQHVHLPFGAGPRICVGMRFVLTQVKLCLTKVLTRFEVVPAPTTPESLEHIECRNILKVGKLDICLKERSSSERV